MMTRCSAASRVPFGGYAALDTASAPRRIGFYRRLSREVISTTSLNGSIPVRPHQLQVIDSKRREISSQIVNLNTCTARPAVTRIASHSFEVLLDNLGKRAIFS
jgi:hypothetical protein